MIKKLASKIVYKNRWMKVREDDVEFADGSKGIYGYIDKSDASLIIPRESRDKFILVRQYRYIVDETKWEFPHGSVEIEKEYPDGKTVAAIEMEEETGYIANKMSLLVKLHIAYGYSNQVVQIFLAEKLKKGTLNPTHGEIGIEVDFFSAAKIEEMILSGKITDTQTISAWYWYNKSWDGK